MLYIQLCYKMEACNFFFFLLANVKSFHKLLYGPMATTSHVPQWSPKRRYLASLKIIFYCGIWTSDHSRILILSNPRLGVGQLTEQNPNHNSQRIRTRGNHLSDSTCTIKPSHIAVLKKGYVKTLKYVGCQLLIGLFLLTPKICLAGLIHTAGWLNAFLLHKPILVGPQKAGDGYHTLAIRTSLEPGVRHFTIIFTELTLHYRMLWGLVRALVWQ